MAREEDASDVSANTLWSMDVRFYDTTDNMPAGISAGLLVIHVLMALYIWAHRKELDAKPAANMEIAAQLLTAAD